ncbi:MAG: phosphatidylserine decarboxylase family protein [Ignavibacteriaceae bacterium]|jgi:phosphatidylserine decarboxylase|nr:phosphatidylserine decarboxylase family protein [Ignavibacteriaceae bacterium]
MITKYGLSTFYITLLVALIIIASGIFVGNNILKYILIIAGIVLALFTINFFRDPERVTPNKNAAVFSPADGKVIIVKDIKDKRFINGKAKQISIFMSPLDVHVNRIPISGKVDYLRYIEGEYLVAFYEKADERNERSEIGITSQWGKVLFTQVAGTIARRIVYNLSEGDSVTAGKRFGMIKFGSRSDVIVGDDWNLKVKLGDRVTAGETILFEKGNDD